MLQKCDINYPIIAVFNNGITFAGAADTVQPKDRRETIYELVNGCGYSDWVVAELAYPNGLTTEATYVLFNFKSRKQTALAVPNPWFDDPRRHHVIEELIRLAIQNSGPLVLQHIRPTLLYLNH